VELPPFVVTLALAVVLMMSELPAPVGHAVADPERVARQSPVPVAASVPLPDPVLVALAVEPPPLRPSRWSNERDMNPPLADVL
jgi:hypothetical protein